MKSSLEKVRQATLPLGNEAPEKGPMTGHKSIEGLVERVTFANAENGWSVIKLKTDARDLVTCVGVLPGVREGENLRLSGTWVTDRKWGRQFKVSSFLPVAPSTLTGIKKYLSSGLVPGIGPTMAKRLVRRFGIETLEIIENQPERLSEVEGIGAKRLEQIVSAWKDQRAIKDVMLFLQTHGVTPGYAMKIFRRYGERSIHVVKDNPYRLAIDIHGIGFKTADKIAAQLGIAKDSPQRAQAGVLHTLGELRDNGHVYCPEDELVRASENMLEIDTMIVEDAVRTLAQDGQVVAEEVPEAEARAIYLSALFAAEHEAAVHLGRIAKADPPVLLDLDVEAALNEFEASSGLTLAAAQRDAIRLASSSTLLVITGGPGTGKTTLVRAIIKLLKTSGRRIQLAAPTGRAAKRLEEATHEPARTIHRLLEYSPRSNAFERGPERPLETDLLIVDEASMIDISLLFHLVRSLPTGAQLVLVGDVDQLPSVGPGAVLREVIASRAADVVGLNEIFRQAQASQIVVNAHRVNEGELPVIDDPPPETDFYFIERDEPEEVLATIKYLVGQRIPKRFGLDPFREVQVLTPMHRGILGASNLNAELQELLNPDGETLERGNRAFRVGDKVMQIRNNYDLDVFNGDLGRIQSIDRSAHSMNVGFERNKVITYERSDLDELVPAYACSIHKSQGSEYPSVVVPIHTQHYVMLQRNLLYTAITRGRRLVILVGSRRALRICIKNNRVVDRYTRLGARIGVYEA